MIIQINCYLIFLSRYDFSFLKQIRKDVQTKFQPFLKLLVKAIKVDIPLKRIRMLTEFAFEIDFHVMPKKNFI